MSGKDTVQGNGGCNCFMCIFESAMTQTNFLTQSAFCWGCFGFRFIIYKLPMYKIGKVGSGVDYMYLDSCGGSWQMSKYLVNTSQGALGQTLNQLYMGKAYQVRLHPRFGDSCRCQNLLKHSFGLLSRHSSGELNLRLGS